jgi:hypothetical protein
MVSTATQQALRRQPRSTASRKSDRGTLSHVVRRNSAAISSGDT